MKIEEAIEKTLEKVKENYEIAKTKSFIYDPIGFALYRTWEEHYSKRYGWKGHEDEKIS